MGRSDGSRVAAVPRFVMDTRGDRDGGLHMGNVLIAKDLIRAIEGNTQPRGSIYDGRAALEMILAVYESHRLNAPVSLPLKDRSHPLTRL